MATSAFGVQHDLAKGADLRTRASQAIKPPPVRRKAVTSTALRSIGYQPQTRRLAIEMNSRPGEPYVYRVPKEQAHRVMNADSLGRAYTKEIRGKAKRPTRYTVGDRARLFVSPQ